MELARVQDCTCKRGSERGSCTSEKFLSNLSRVLRICILLVSSLWDPRLFAFVPKWKRMRCCCCSMWTGGGGGWERWCKYCELVVQPTLIQVCKDIGRLGATAAAENGWLAGWVVVVVQWIKYVSQSVVRLSVSQQ